MLCLKLPTKNWLLKTLNSKWFVVSWRRFFLFWPCTFNFCSAFLGCYISIESYLLGLPPVSILSPTWFAHKTNSSSLQLNKLQDLFVFVALVFRAYVTTGGLKLLSLIKAWKYYMFYMFKQMQVEQFISPVNIKSGKMRSLFIMTSVVLILPSESTGRRCSEKNWKLSRQVSMSSPSVENI